MKAGTKALNTDIVKVMQGIVNSHVEHYQSDFELDIEVLKEAAEKPGTDRTDLCMAVQAMRNQAAAGKKCIYKKDTRE